MPERTTPVTVLSGTLGAGKTTMLNHVLAECGDREIAVLVNDMGEVNVDAELVAESSDVSAADEELIELSNGCICCELRGDLLEAIDSLTRERSFDAIVVESTGVAEPLPVAQTLTLGFDQTDLDPTEFYEETGIEPLERCHLDATVTVVDAHQFREAMRSDEVLDDDGTKKPLGDLLVEQVEFCDVLVVNKSDLVPDDDLDEIEATIRRLQPRAEVVRTEHGRIDPDRILDTGRFDFEAARQSPGWLRELREAHATAEDEHGVSSFVFRERGPFHPERFADFLDGSLDEVVRAKGHFWLAGRETEALTLNVAGQSIRVGPGGRWLAAAPPDEREAALADHPDLAESWDDEWGDRSVVLVVIGVEMDREAVRSDLEACLLRDEEFDEDWSTYEDRFPVFDPDGEDPTAAEGAGDDPDTDAPAEAEREIGLSD